MAEGAAVVGHEKQDGVFRQSGLVEECHKSPHVGVDVADHREVAHEVAFAPGRHARQLRVGHHFLHHLDVLVRRVKRPVRRVGRQVGEERLAGGRAAFHPVDGMVEENVGAVAGKFFAFAVPAVGVVEVVVAPVIRHGADMRGREPQRLLEAAILRAVRVIVAEVPLTKNTGAVAVFAEQVGHRWEVGPQERAAAADVDRAVARRVESGHERAARRRAHRRGVVVREAQALRVQLVEDRCVEHRVAVRGEFGIPLIIRHHHDHIRPGRLAKRKGRRHRRPQEKGREKSHGRIVAAPASIAQPASAPLGQACWSIGFVD